MQMIWIWAYNRWVRVHVGMNQLTETTQTAAKAVQIHFNKFKCLNIYLVNSLDLEFSLLSRDSCSNRGCKAGAW